MCVCVCLSVCLVVMSYPFMSINAEDKCGARIPEAD